MYITFPQLRDRAIALLDRLGQLGVVVPPGSRLLRYLSELQTAAIEQYSDPPEAVRRVWHRLLAEVDDFETIVTSLGHRPEVEGWREKLQVALGGGVVRTDEVRHSPARDIQFELLVAAVFRRAGYAVQLAEPDILISTTIGPFGIAAKRLYSLTKVEANIRKAAKQIAGANCPGIIATDVSILINPKDVELNVRIFDAANRYVLHRATNATKHVAANVGLRVGTEAIAGVLGYAAIPTWEPTERRMSYIKRWPMLFLVGTGD